MNSWKDNAPATAWKRVWNCIVFYSCIQPKQRDLAMIPGWTTKKAEYPRINEIGGLIYKLHLT